MEIRGQYTAAVGATAVTLTAVPGLDDEDTAGAHAMLGTGTIVINVGVAPDTGFWHVGRYLIEISRLS